MGKGTGRSAKLARLRREARRYMDECRDAIPVWIMPRYLVADMVEPFPSRYDLVIVDEASQLGIESLFLFFIARKIIVVGDDQQISPAGVGVDDKKVAGLQQHFLAGIPHQHALSPQSSLYANAKIRFNQNIVLREHFRCMPEIIQFSNDLCYASNGTPLDPLRAYPADRLDPLVLRYVSEGYREGKSHYAQNPPEAEAIVRQISACIEDPRYAGRTMGVISLQGEAQAKLIERLLLQAIEPEVIAGRRLICGDAYAFQGDERSVVFLSMVAAPGTRIGALANDAARQRFNVAVSRAQDQLWLFHSAELDVLSRTCMRHTLLTYMHDPKRQETDENEQSFDSQFERAVYQQLTARGFHVRTNVSVGDPTNHRYRIDLVVEGMQGRLAVECDGDKWHGPDRYEQDMARQRDLERAGWQFARIRGSHFFRDPTAAMEPIWAELDRLGIKPGGIDRALADPPDPKPLEFAVVPAAVFGGELNHGPPPENNETSHEDPSAGQGESSPPQPPATAAPEGPEPAQSPEPASRGDNGAQTSGTSNRTHRGILAPYVEFTGLAGPDPRNGSPARTAEGLRRIVEIEGPMVVKRVFDLYLRGCDIHRMGGLLRHLMSQALQLSVRRGQLILHDELGLDELSETVRLKEGPKVLPRQRGPRDFDEIPPSELQLIARRIANAEGAEPGSEDHMRRVLDALELKRLTSQVSTRLLDALTRRYSYVDEILDRDQ